MRIDVKTAAQLLKQSDNILILCHAHPDGDTLGCGFGLLRMLQKLGKRSRVMCADEIAKKYSFMSEGLRSDDGFAPDFIAAVDVADIKLLSDSFAKEYEGKIDLCIDHHGSNTGYAKHTLLDASAAACSEIFCELADELSVEITPDIADCLYTGIATDTGCFKFSNTTSRTHMLAARLIDCGANISEINRVFFETKTRTYAALERLALDSMRMYFDDRCAVISITQQMFRQSGSNDSETDAISALSRQIEGVLVGVTLKEGADGSFKVSVRTHTPVSAAEICKRLGGGGHTRAAGCRLHVPLEEAIEQVLEQVETQLKLDLPDGIE